LRSLDITRPNDMSPVEVIQSGARHDELPTKNEAKRERSWASEPSS